MPVLLAAQVLFQGLASIPYAYTILKAAICLTILYYVKVFFGGAKTLSERVMHSKVVMVTGGTSGVGAAVVRDLASRGAQIVLLTQQPLTDPFLVDYIMDLRIRTGNELITAEYMDLADLHSIRIFATKWIDNTPPRRLDMVILCGNTLTPGGSKIEATEDGVEINWGVNYLANFQLLNILSPALRAQPPDRDVRVIIGACSSYMGGRLPGISYDDKNTTAGEKGRESKDTSKPELSNAGAFYGTSKLALMTFACAYQKHLEDTPRPDKKPLNTRVLMVDPGWTRSPGMRRFLTRGTLWGLGLYLVTYPLWWLFLKSTEEGAQTFLHAAMEAEYSLEKGGKLLKECREVPIARPEVLDEEVQKALWKASKMTVQQLEKEAASRRAKAKPSGNGKAAKPTLAKVEELPDDAPAEASSNTTRSSTSAKKTGSRRSRKVAA
ncbi:NAD(P)-binding protein [Eremomyces bilateralis CBS 781.70]|uniref:NAD(P)-binding protein n=1 Tax=Eremomyces bilateralis CBS 781.70 TaxID=1392243 RepID=A0A6G1G890_9PEZI|nr:NAD(P)-binding protein [Eremomyces bilateralis CBS 781.70]KAF1814243.1 NAD(P)-binding protein [Eremomyces bilateralis CBS 781.70]